MGNAYKVSGKRFDVATERRLHKATETSDQRRLVRIRYDVALCYPFTTVAPTVPQPAFMAHAVLAPPASAGKRLCSAAIAAPDWSRRKLPLQITNRLTHFASDRH